MTLPPTTRHLARLIALMMAVAGSPRLASASSQDLFGFGARGIAMGGAVVSNSTGFPAIYYNPAGLMLVDRNSFTLGYQRADFGMTMNGDAYDVDPASNLLLGVNIPIPFGGVLADRFAFGLGFIIPTSSILRAAVPAPEDPFFVLVEHRSQIVGVHAGLGVRITDWLYAGFGVVALAELIGSLTVAPNTSGNLGTVVRDELVADYSLIAGILVTPLDWLSIGLTYHGASEARFTFPINTDLGSEFPIEIPELNVAGVGQFDPMQVSGDVTFRPVPQLEVAVGVTFKKWSDFINPIQNTTEPVPEQDPPDFSDTWIPRLGLEYTIPANEMTWNLRLGGFYEPTPTPEQTANANYLDANRWGIGGGAGWSWRGLTVDLAIQGQLMSDRTHTKDPQSVRNPENVGLPGISSTGHIIVSVLEVGLSF